MFTGTQGETYTVVDGGWSTEPSGRAEPEGESAAGRLEMRDRAPVHRGEHRHQESLSETRIGWDGQGWIVASGAKEY